MIKNGKKLSQHEKSIVFTNMTLTNLRSSTILTISKFILELSYFLKKTFSIEKKHCALPPNTPPLIVAGLTWK